jgi:hypothetical protein
MENSTKATDTSTSRSTWDTILTTTPVILTVLGTLLAGLSSSEMTLAQYFRSLAAQSQSKAGDQWGFFQAKRIRGQTQEATLELLPALTRYASVSPDSIRESGDRLSHCLLRITQRTEHLQQAVGKASDSLGKAGDPLVKAMTGLEKATAQACQSEEKALRTLTLGLSKPTVVSAFAYLGTQRLPEANEERFDNADLEELLRAVAERRPEREIFAVVLRLPSETIEGAIESAETTTRNFEKTGEPVAETLEALRHDVKAVTAPVLPIHQSILDVDAALTSVPLSRELADVHSAATALARDDAALKSAAEDLAACLTMLRLDYEARRYRREATYNRRVAGLYEVQVRKLSAESERHRSRSMKFFYGMLGAQAGVAIASLALAARFKSVLWGLAGVTGLVALLFSGYVYLYH